MLRPEDAYPPILTRLSFPIVLGKLPETAWVLFYSIISKRIFMFTLLK